MRLCVLQQVPVRMGLGRGTFYELMLSTEISGSIHISRSRFVGTAVINAYAAESCGGKGMRIFVHASAASDLQTYNRLQLLPLRPPLLGAAFELDYLSEPTRALAKPSPDSQDQELFDAIHAMKGGIDSPKVRRQYVHTLKALNAMRRLNGRKPVRARKPLAHNMWTS